MDKNESLVEENKMKKSFHENIVENNSNFKYFQYFLFFILDLLHSLWLSSLFTMDALKDIE